MEISSGLQREFWMDLTASSAVNRPIISASLRSVVVWMGVRSMRCTYSGARVPLRFTFTRNLVFFMLFPPGSRDNHRCQNEGGPYDSPDASQQCYFRSLFQETQNDGKLQIGLNYFRKRERVRRDISLSYNINPLLNCCQPANFDLKQGEIRAARSGQLGDELADL